ncbi:Protein of unknown function [Lactobacillus helveticus CIRM-BIA 953]|uniref:Uncharacterized protein n=1 Tax=Lactobacillus helveticus CIRM-BIA 953 TaxID=1226335 RepID=U4QFL2_LACHE|nr:Protein of unknown function [Lactobacillus helveticus CIRM-BIA 953]CDI43352.1 Protein of unknown function [Lactobacillus helveticus CIRM-BIA 953]
MIDTFIKVILLLLMAGGAVALVLICTMLIIDLFKRIGGKD